MSTEPKQELTSVDLAALVGVLGSSEGPSAGDSQAAGSTRVASV
ncbi:hypothetical protein [Natronosalvus caseinilyticus]|nr:hypothetical protein [Natronosalvus caseinilyticus]